MSRMTIVCGTDFSQPASEAEQVAGVLARRTGDVVRLVHVVDDVGLDWQTTSLADTAYDPLRRRLDERVQTLRALGARVDDALLSGRPDEVLCEVSRQTHSWLVVLSSLGRGAAARWLMGSVSERTAQSCAAPVLVVRGSDAIEAWTVRTKRLKIVVGVDLTAASKAAYRWTESLRALGPCDVVAAHVAWPPGEHARQGVKGPIHMDALEESVERRLRTDLLQHLGELGGEGECELLIRAGMGRVDYHLSSWATDLGADLLVVGSNHRAGLDRLLHGAVSRGVLHLAPMSVVCVPKSED